MNDLETVLHYGFDKQFNFFNNQSQKLCFTLFVHSYRGHSFERHFTGALLRSTFNVN